MSFGDVGVYILIASIATQAWARERKSKIVFLNCALQSLEYSEETGGERQAGRQGTAHPLLSYPLLSRVSPFWSC